MLAGASTLKLGLRPLTRPRLRLGCQSIFGEPVQDPQISARVPRPIRLHRGCTCLLSALLPLVQPRPPSQRNRAADAGYAALRHGITGHRAATKRARPSLSSYPGTLRPNPTKAPAPAQCGLDQPAYPDTGDRGNSTLNSDATCLTIVDTLRWRRIRSSPRIQTS